MYQLYDIYLIQSIGYYIDNMYIVRSRKFVLLIALYFLTFAFSVQAAVPYRISNFSVDSLNSVLIL